MKTIQSRVAIAMCIAATITGSTALVGWDCAQRCDPDIKAARAQLGVYTPPSVVICDVESIATVAASGDADCKACYAACSVCRAACKATEQQVHGERYNVDTFDLGSCESDCADDDAAAAVMEASDNCDRAKSLLWQAKELAPYETVATCTDYCEVEKAHNFTKDGRCNKFTEVCLAHKFVADVHDPYGGNVQDDDALDEIAHLAGRNCMEVCNVEDGGAPCFKLESNDDWFNYGYQYVLDENSFVIGPALPGKNGSGETNNNDEYVAVDDATNTKFRATCALCEGKCDAVVAAINIDDDQDDDDDVVDRHETIVDFYKKDCGSEINLEGFADCAIYRGSGIRAGTGLFFDVYDEYNKLGGRFHDRDEDFSEDDWRKEFIPRANYTDMTCPDRCDMLAEHEFYRTNFSYQIYEGTQAHVNTLCTKYDAVVQAAQGVCATSETGNCAAVLVAINASNAHAEFIGSSVQSSASNIQRACNLVAAMMMAACLMV